SSADLFFIKLYGGYGLLTPGSYRGNSTKQDYENFSSGKLGAGAGLHYGAGLGLVVNDFLNIGVDAELLSGKLHSSTSSRNTYTNSHFQQTVSYSVTSIIPNITFKALSKPGYYIYTRVGLIIAVSTKIEFANFDSSYSTGSGAVTLINGDENYYFKVNAGIQTSVGAQFNITDKLKGFGEITGYILPASPTHSKQQYTTTSYGPTFSSYSTVTSYNYTYKRYGSYAPVSTLNSTGGADISANQPSITQDINYIGVNIGIVFRF
ncbi:MAG: hypothetical protein JST13_12915, partial [Bacteroidetes bacterium]|nr:hypothetical protein [Bacteroidota bacterium]